MKKILLFLVSVSLFIHIGVSFIDSYGDIQLYFIPWAKSVNQHGYANFYQRVENANYPPIAIYILSISYNIGKTIAHPVMDTLLKINNTVPLFPSKLLLFMNEQKIINSTIKFPFIIADIFLALGILAILRLYIKNSKTLLFIFSLILFNPAFIYNSALWGQMDALPLAFGIWSMYFLVKNKPTISITLFVLGLLSKQTIGVLIPVYGLFLIKNCRLEKIIKSSIYSIILVYLLFFPFYKTGNFLLYPFITFYTIATTFGGNALSAHAFNFWWMITDKAHLPDSSKFFLLFSAAFWSKLFVGSILFYVLWNSMKYSKKHVLRFFVIMSFFCMGVFLFATRMHERHLFPALPFLLLSGLYHSIFYTLFIAVSMIQFLNLYAAWSQPPFYPLVDLLKNVVFTDFFIGILIFLFLYIFTFISYKNKPKHVR